MFQDGSSPKKIAVLQGKVLGVHFIHYICQNESPHLAGFLLF